MIDRIPIPVPPKALSRPSVFVFSKTWPKEARVFQGKFCIYSFFLLHDVFCCLTLQYKCDRFVTDPNAATQLVNATYKY